MKIISFHSSFSQLAAESPARLVCISAHRRPAASCPRLFAAPPATRHPPLCCEGVEGGRGCDAAPLVEGLEEREKEEESTYKPILVLVEGLEERKRGNDAFPRWKSWCSVCELRCYGVRLSVRRSFLSVYT